MSLEGGCACMCGETCMISAAKEEDYFESDGEHVYEIFSKLSFYDVCHVSVRIYCSL